MPPTFKENEILAAKPEMAQRPTPTSTLAGDTAIKQQPVALEVPVTVNGARTVEGSDKREPFSETTKTVLVIGNGAVIRLSSSVAPGQLLFLTNEKTKKEVVCQVVKSKNYRSLSGYVELEFTESVVGFWGMRFPSDRLGAGPETGAPSPVSSSSASGLPAIPRPVALTVEAPAANGTSSVVAAKPAVPGSLAPVPPLSSTLSTSFDPAAPLNPAPAAPVAAVIPVVSAAPVSASRELALNSAPANPVPPASTLFVSSRASEEQASILEPPKSPGAPATIEATTSPAAFDVKPVAPAAVHPPQELTAGDPQTDALKLHTARLQKQLSSMLFSGAPAAPPAVSAQTPHAPPVVIQKELAVGAAKALELSRTHAPEPVPAKPVEHVKHDPPPAKSPVDKEELRIPAWLEPLARNAAAPASTLELIEREKAKRLAGQPEVEETAAETFVAVKERNIAELPLQTFDDTIPDDEEKSAGESESNGSSRGMLTVAIAAGVLLLAGGGWWYMRPQSGAANAGPTPTANVQASVVSLPGESSPSQPKGNASVQTNPPAQANPAALTNTATHSNSAPSPLSVVPAAASAATAHNSQPTSNPANGGTGATTSASAEPAAEQPKKPMLGKVHLATPNVTQSRQAQDRGEADAAGIALNGDGQPGPSVEALTAGLVGGNKQPTAPAAPLPIGGDVKPARLIFSVQPSYPMLAKSQHVSGNVLVDALIDATGRVTAMNVVSGPTLLHQAAMDALKQWKYQPASLDGKPVPMHLAVTIRFRLQ
jgi:TonB family protein